MKRFTLAALALSAASFSQATLWTYTAALNGFQEVPPTSSAAIANVLLQLDDVTFTLSGSGTVQFLSGTATGFHLHQAAYGVSGPIVVDLGAGSVSGNSISFASVPVPNFATVKAAMDARNTYLNIHTASFPGGEIRGQVAPVPEPASLIAVGLGVAAMLRRRKR